MPMMPDEIESMIKAALPQADVQIDDLRGDGDHYHVTVTAPDFSDKTRIEQHKIVYAALQGKMGNELHAMSLTTKAI
ncbi:MAG: BolA/IbaG family iron-sulfur metabolism protein [Bdellovibrionales bacterium]